MKLQRVVGFVEYKFSSNIVKPQLVKLFSVVYAISSNLTSYTRGLPFYGDGGLK